MEITNRNGLLILGLVCLLAVAIISLGPLGLGTIESSTEISGTSSSLPDSESVGLVRRPLNHAQSNSLIVLDLDSGTEVFPAGELVFKPVKGEKRLLLFSSSDLPEKLLEIDDLDGGTFSYFAPSVDSESGVKCFASLEEETIISTGEGRVALTLPYLPSVSIRVAGSNGEAVGDAPCTFFLLPREGFNKAKVEAQTNTLVANTAYPFEQIENVLLGYKSIAETDLVRYEHRSNEMGEVSAILPAAGLLVVIIPSMEHRLYWRSIAIQPGSNGPFSCSLNPRPKAMGKITYSDGTPAAGVTVSLATYLVPNDIDYSSNDRHHGSAMSGVKKADGTIHRVVRKSVRTNWEGEYSASMPFGMEYMVEVKTQFYYTSKVHPNGNLDVDGVLHQDFEILSENESLVANSGVVSLEVVAEDGTVLKDVTVGMAPYLDEPWFRIYPETNTGSEGYVDLPWLSVGDWIMITFKHESWEHPRLEIIEIDKPFVSAMTKPKKTLPGTKPKGW